MTYSFHSDNLDSGRLYWHPAAHRLGGEECGFYLVRVRDPSNAVLLDKFMSAFDGAQIGARCLYVSLGYFDVLVRTWANGDRRRAFLRRMESLRRDYILDIREMRVDHVAYDPELYGHVNLEVDYDALADIHADEIKEVADGSVTGDLLVNRSLQEKADSLKSLGLILVADPVPNDRLKFYVAFEPSGSARQQPRDDFEDILGRNISDLRPAALYRGSGFATYLLKGVAAGMQEVAELNDSLINLASEHGLRPMTLVIANRNVIESDTLDALVVGEHSADVRRMIRALYPDESASPMIRRPPIELERASKIYTAYAPAFAESQSLRAFHDLLRGAIEDDVEALVQQSMWNLANVELAFRQYVITRLLPSLAEEEESSSWLLEFRTWVVGTRYESHFRSADVEDEQEIVSMPSYAETSGATESTSEDGTGKSRKWKPPSKWTLHNCITATRLGIERSALLQVRLTDDLGTDVLKLLSRVAPVRNEFAHGSVLLRARPWYFAEASALELNDLLAIVLLRESLAGIFSRSITTPEILGD